MSASAGPSTDWPIDAVLRACSAWAEPDRIDLDVALQITNFGDNALRTQSRIELHLGIERDRRAAAMKFLQSEFDLNPSFGRKLAPQDAYDRLWSLTEIIPAEAAGDSRIEATVASLVCYQVHPERATGRLALLCDIMSDDEQGLSIGAGAVPIESLKVHVVRKWLTEAL